MASKAMSAVIHALIKQVREDKALQSLLISTTREEERPILKVGGKDYIVGLVDEKPMLLGVKDKMLLNPDFLVDGDVTEITWKLK